VQPNPDFFDLHAESSARAGLLINFYADAKLTIGRLEKVRILNSKFTVGAYTHLHLLT
jgi:hypothetical protein